MNRLEVIEELAMALEREKDTRGGVVIDCMTAKSAIRQLSGEDWSAAQEASAQQCAGSDTTARNGPFCPIMWDSNMFGGHDYGTCSADCAWYMKKDKCCAIVSMASGVCGIREIAEEVFL